MMRVQLCLDILWFQCLFILFDIVRQGSFQLQNIIFWCSHVYIVLDESYIYHKTCRGLKKQKLFLNIFDNNFFFLKDDNNIINIFLVSQFIRL